MYEVPRAFSLQRGAVSGPSGNNTGHEKNTSTTSMMSSLNNQGENIYDSKLNEERPQINKSLGKHQINNNLQMWRSMGIKFFKELPEDE